MVVAAEVIEVMERSGMKGIYRVRCQAKDDMGRTKVLIRNVMGPVKVGDKLMIREVDMDTAVTIG